MSMDFFFQKLHVNNLHLRWRESTRVKSHESEMMRHALPFDTRWLIDSCFGFRIISQNSTSESDLNHVRFTSHDIPSAI